MTPRLGLLFSFICVSLGLANVIELFYTEDGEKISSIRGFNINRDLTLIETADESWLIAAGYQIGPNGYMAKQSKLTLGGFGKKAALFNVSDNFLGLGQNRRYERPIVLSDIAYILPNPKPFEPLLVTLVDGREGELFVAGDYTECVGQKKIGQKIESNIFIVKLKYNVPKSQRKHTTRPQQLGIKAKAISFSERALRKAIRRGKIP